MWALLLQQQQQQRKEIILLDQAMQKIIQAIYDKNRRKVEVKPNEKLEKTKLMENLKGRFKLYISIYFSFFFLTINTNETCLLCHSV